MSRKKKLIISIVTGVVLATAVTFIILGCTVWRPKTAQEWLFDFRNSLEYQTENFNQKIQKSIVITEGETIVAQFFQLVEIAETDGKVTAHLIVEEKYPTVSSFDVYDEYYFLNNVMYLKRIENGEVVKNNFPSSTEIFWRTVNINLAQEKYNFDKKVFANYKINHTKILHTLSATVKDEMKERFFGESEKAQNVENIVFGMTLDQNLNLKEFEMNYTMQNRTVKTIVKKTSPSEVTMPKEFA